jgi:putative aldouronate transport system permease protein
MLRSTSFGSRLADILIFLAVGLTALLSVFPLAHTVAVSLSSAVAADSHRVVLWPVSFTLASYNKLIVDPLFFNAYRISLERVLLGGGFSILISILVAYPLSREVRDFPARRFYIWVFVVPMLFSGGLIPFYMTVSKLHMIDTMWSLVLPFLVTTFYILLLMNFFRGLPREIEESAWIDGAGPWMTLLRIVLPLSKPALATVALLTCVGFWNEFFYGYIFINDPHGYPLQTYIYTLTAGVNYSTLATMTPDEIANLMKVSSTTFTGAKLVVAMIPIIMVYPFLQRYFIHGIVLGSVKE